MDHEFDRAMLSCLSWSLYQPASTARRTIDTSDDPNPFKRLTFVPLSADDRGRTVLTGEITALLGGEYEVAVSIGARGQPTSLGGVLDAIDAALSGRATAEMLADLRDRGGLRAMEADRKRWQQLGPNPPREPTIFEAWDGDERSLTVRHYVGNGVCAYFEGFSAYRAGAGVYTVLIGT